MHRSVGTVAPIRGDYLRITLARSELNLRLETALELLTSNCFATQIKNRVAFSATLAIYRVLTICPEMFPGNRSPTDRQLNRRRRSAKPIKPRLSKASEVGVGVTQGGWFGPPQVPNVLLPIVVEIAALVNAPATVP